MLRRRGRSRPDSSTPSMTPDQIADAQRVGRSRRLDPDRPTTRPSDHPGLGHGLDPQDQRSDTQDPSDQADLTADRVRARHFQEATLPGALVEAGPEATAPHWGAGSAARAAREQTAVLDDLETRVYKILSGLRSVAPTLPTSQVRRFTYAVIESIDNVHRDLHGMVLGDIEAREVWAERVASESTPMYYAVEAETLQRSLDSLGAKVEEALEARLSYSDTRPDPSDVRAEWIGRPPSPFLGPPVHEVRIDPLTLAPYRAEVVLDGDPVETPAQTPAGTPVEVANRIHARGIVPPAHLKPPFPPITEELLDARIEEQRRRDALRAMQDKEVVSQTRLCLGCVARGHEHTYGPGCELDRPYDERDQDA